MGQFQDEYARHIKTDIVQLKILNGLPFSNPLAKCSEIPAGDLTPWKDTSLIEKMKQIKEEEEAEKKAAPDKEETIRDSEL